VQGPTADGEGASDWPVAPFVEHKDRSAAVSSVAGEGLIKVVIVSVVFNCPVHNVFLQS
jgi:hypothetical protein